MKALIQVQTAGMSSPVYFSSYRLAKVAAKKAAHFGAPSGGQVLVQAKGAHYTYIPMYAW